MISGLQEARGDPFVCTNKKLNIWPLHLHYGSREGHVFLVSQSLRWWYELVSGIALVEQQDSNFWLRRA